MKIRGMLSVSAFIFAQSSALAAEDWQAIPTSSPNVTFAIDRGSIQRKKQTVRFWEKLTYATPEVLDQASGKWIKEKMVHRVMNCEEKTQGLTQGVTYADKKAFITSLSFDEKQVKMSAIPPDTIAAKELLMVCDAVQKQDE